MNISTYLENKKKNQESESEKFYRQACLRCRKEISTCYCKRIQAFESELKIVILIHPMEARNKIGTGRLAHLCIKNSELIEGIDFSDNKRLNHLLSHPQYFPVVLYPGEKAIDIGNPNSEKLEEKIPKDKKLLIIIIDAKWSVSRKILRISRNLHPLLQLKFIPQEPSIYQIRKQPKALCLSTIESIQFVLKNFQDTRFKTKQSFETLTTSFRFMISQQLEFSKLNNGKAVRGIRVGCTSDSSSNRKI